MSQDPGTSSSPGAGGCLSFLVLAWVLLHAPQILVFLDRLLAWHP